MWLYLSCPPWTYTFGFNTHILDQTPKWRSYLLTWDIHLLTYCGSTLPYLSHQIPRTLWPPSSSLSTSVCLPLQPHCPSTHSNAQPLKDQWQMPLFTQSRCNWIKGSTRGWNDVGIWLLISCSWKSFPRLLLKSSASLNITYQFIVKWQRESERKREWWWARAVAVATWAPLFLSAGDSWLKGCGTPLCLYLCACERDNEWVAVCSVRERVKYDRKRAKDREIVSNRIQQPVCVLWCLHISCRRADSHWNHAGFFQESGGIAGSMWATSRALYIPMQGIISLLTQELWKYEKCMGIYFTFN